MVVAVFRGKSALHNAVILRTLAKLGPNSIYEIKKRFDLDYGMMNRRMNGLERRGYVHRTISKSKKGRERFPFVLTLQGKMASAFLDMSDKELEDALYFDDFSKQITSGSPFTNVKFSFKMNSDGSISSTPEFSNEKTLPTKIRLQLEFLRDNPSPSYFKTRWGEEYSQLIN